MLTTAHTDLNASTSSAEVVLEKAEGRTGRSARMQSAIAQLPVRGQAVLALVFVEGLTAAEAGAVLGIGERTVQRILERTVSMVKDTIIDDANLRA